MDGGDRGERAKLSLSLSSVHCAEEGACLFFLSLQRKAEVGRREAERGARHVPGEGNFEGEKNSGVQCHRNDAAESPPLYRVASSWSNSLCVCYVSLPSCRERERERAVAACSSLIRTSLGCGEGSDIG
jgi:hypothetical protein